MAARILLVMIIILLLATLVFINAGRIDDGSFVSRSQCDEDRLYYNQYEKECDVYLFYAPIVLIPLWLLLVFARGIVYVSNE